MVLPEGQQGCRAVQTSTMLLAYRGLNCKLDLFGGNSQFALQMQNRRGSSKRAWVDVEESARCGHNGRRCSHNAAAAALGALCFRHSFVAFACFLLLLCILHVNDMIVDASAIGVALPAFGARASRDIAL